MRPMDALLDEHEMILEKFDLAVKHQGSDRGFYLNDLAESLALHLANEKEQLIPQMFPATIAGPLFRDFENTEAHVAHILKQVGRFQSSNEKAKQRLKRLRKRLKQHFIEEETLVFKFLQRSSALTFDLAS